MHALIPKRDACVDNPIFCLDIGPKRMDLKISCMEQLSIQQAFVKVKVASSFQDRGTRPKMPIFRANFGDGEGTAI